MVIGYRRGDDVRIIDNHIVEHQTATTITSGRQER